MWLSPMLGSTIACQIKNGQRNVLQEQIFLNEMATQMVRQDMNWEERHRSRTRMGNGTGSYNGSESSDN
jgi:hypothetical protein